MSYFKIKKNKYKNKEIALKNKYKILIFFKETH